MPERFPVLLSPDEDGWIVAICPVIPGCVSQGRTREEALVNIQEAIELALECQADEGWSIADGFEWTEVRRAS